MKEIKTKSGIKDIKVLDKASNVSHRMKNAYIHTKEQTEQNGHNEDGNYVDDAVSRTRDGTETVGRRTVTAGGHSKNAVWKIKERRAGGTGTSNTITRGDQLGHTSYPGTKVPKSKQRYVQGKATLTAKQTAERKAAQTFQNSVFQPAEKAALQVGKIHGQTGRRIKQFARERSITVKQATKGTVKTAQRRVKTIERSTATATIKASRSAAKNTVKTAQTAKRATQATQAATRVAAVSAKTMTKAMVATIKTIIATLKSLLAMIAAGGWAAVVIILLVCLVGLMSESVFGVFFSNEDTGKNTPVMTEAVSQLNGNFTARIEQIENENPHNTLDLSNNGSSTMVSNWRDLLAVYAVKVATDPENGIEVATLDNKKVEILRNIFWDMNKIDYWLETIEHTDGKTTSTETVLHIHVISKSYSDMIAQYNFNVQQAGMLNELMQDKYKQLFLNLIGSYEDITLSPQEISAISKNLPADLNEQRKRAVLAAYSLVGKVNYFWGGKSTVIGWDSRWGTPAKVTDEGSATTGSVRPFGLDCSGYVAWVFVNTAGNTDTAKIIGTGTASQYAACAPVSWVSAQPGDLAFYSDLSHVGIVVGKQNGDLLIANCNAGENNVAVTRVSGASSSGFFTIGRTKFFE
ncbi:hypothetical protein UNSWDHB_2245 [Dehalobacter sp. UNSWDHB]|uniref:C40 family peptidase n=1 Tax=Dehalobacter sp. UNSWDHB TaxID=1339256 RepID=UPI000387647D|nr:NlpC/P60 family protein [Dehalobacter sp. UNSWDHB]EQB20417.1 hypothetical protein UNSWDHB_2245 [Dehalobacter sp. UNSWDHB]